LIFGVAFMATAAISQAAKAYFGSQQVHVNYDTSLQSMLGFDYTHTGTLQLTLNPMATLTVSVHRNTMCLCFEYPCNARCEWRNALPDKGSECRLAGVRRAISKP
jgi:hypothetical protein